VSTFLRYGSYPTCSDISLSAELGVDVEVKQVNLLNGENFEPSFIKLNPKATLPTLTVGSTVYTDTASVVSYLNSVAASPVSEPTDFVTLIHEDKYDPNFALLLAVSGYFRFAAYLVSNSRDFAYREVMRSSRVRLPTSLESSLRTVR
jgi:hypothetical protein